MATEFFDFDDEESFKVTLDNMKFKMVLNMYISQSVDSLNSGRVRIVIEKIPANSDDQKSFEERAQGLRIKHVGHDLQDTRSNSQSNDNVSEEIVQMYGKKPYPQIVLNILDDGHGMSYKQVH